MKNITIKQAIIGLILAVTALIGGNQVMDNLGSFTFKSPTLLNATTTTATSEAIDIEGASKVTLFLQDTSLNMGTSTYTFQVSVDGTNFVTYNRLIDNVTNTNSQNLTRVATKVFTSAGTAIYDMDIEQSAYKSLKVINTIEGNATSTVKSLIQY